MAGAKFSIDSQAVAAFNAGFEDPTPPVSIDCELSQAVLEILSQKMRAYATAESLRNDP